MRPVAPWEWRVADDQARLDLSILNIVLCACLQDSVAALIDDCRCILVVTGLIDVIIATDEGEED